MIKKITTVCILVILAALIMVPATQAQSPSHGHTAAITAGSGGVNIVQGKITPSGMLFIILEQIPGQNAYGQIQATANDPNFEIMLYNPNVAQAVTLSIATWGGQKNGTLTNPTWANVTINAPQKGIATLQFSVSFTSSEEQMTMEIDGVGYQFQEQAISSPLFPFYTSGEIGFFAFVTITTGITIIIAFGLSLIILKKARYFPPIQGTKLLLLTVATTGFLAMEILQNYYMVITQQWYVWEIPVFLLMIVIFLSHIPAHVKRGILIRFLAEHNKGEAYTEILSILTVESVNTTAPEGYRSAQMEYLDRKSYLDFFRRLVGIKTEIVFSDGPLPDQMAKPEKIPISKYQTMRFLKRLANRKREATDFDFGYLIANGEKIEIIKTEKPGSKLKQRYLVIPLSGHHSSYIEDFLAGIEDSALKGERINTYKEQNAQLKAKLMSGTYLNDQSIIDTIGEILNLKEKREGPTPQLESKKTDGDTGE